MYIKEKYPLINGIVLAANDGNIVAQELYRKVEFVYKSIRIQIENSPPIVMKLSF